MSEPSNKNQIPKKVADLLNNCTEPLSHLEAIELIISRVGKGDDGFYSGFHGAGVRYTQPDAISIIRGIIPRATLREKNQPSADKLQKLEDLADMAKEMWNESVPHHTAGDLDAAVREAARVIIGGFAANGRRNPAWIEEAFRIILREIKPFIRQASIDVQACGIVPHGDYDSFVSAGMGSFTKGEKDMVAWSVREDEDGYFVQAGIMNHLSVQYHADDLIGAGQALSLAVSDLLRSLQGVEDLNDATCSLSDTRRLDHLERTIKACPYTDIYHDEMIEDEPWVMEIEGCDMISFRAATLRELIDQSVAFNASGEDFDTWQKQKEENAQG